MASAVPPSPPVPFCGDSAAGDALVPPALFRASAGRVDPGIGGKAVVGT